MSEELPSRQTHGNDGLLTAIQSLLVLIVVALFIVTFTVQPIRIPTESMEPTLKVGDFLLMNKQSYSKRGWVDIVLPPTAVQRGDVVVFHFPLDPSIPVVKRVIALPGDRLRLRDGHVLLNGQNLSEPYAVFTPALPDIFRDDFPNLHNMNPTVDPAWWLALRRNVKDGELLVPPGQFFVLGDNRNNSWDSRFWGFVPSEAIVGRPLLVVLSTGERRPGATFRQRLTGIFQGERLIR